MNLQNEKACQILVQNLIKFQNTVTKKSVLKLPEERTDCLRMTTVFSSYTFQHRQKLNDSRISHLNPVKIQPREELNKCVIHRHFLTESLNELLQQNTKEIQEIRELGSNSWVRPNNEVCCQKTSVGANQIQSAKCREQGHGTCGSKPHAEAQVQSSQERREAKRLYQMSHGRELAPPPYLTPLSNFGVFFNSSHEERSGTGLTIQYLFPQ